MAEGGYPAIPPAAGWVFKVMVSFVGPALTCWVLYSAWRHGLYTTCSIPADTIAGGSHVVAVVFLMGQASVFVGFAKQAPKLVHRVIAAQEQAKGVIQPASFRQR